MTTERPDDFITVMEGEFQQIIGRVIIHDQKTSGTAGGTFTTGAWRTRDLNITVLNTLGSGYSLSANQFTLPASNYIIFAVAPAYRVGRAQTRLRNITDGATVLSGSSHFPGNTGVTQTYSFIIGDFSIAASKMFEVQHQCSITFASQGFGVDAGTSFAVDEEVYTMVYLWKIG